MLNWIITAGVLTTFCGCNFGIETVSEIVVKPERTATHHKYSDRVCAGRWYRPMDQNDPHNTIEAIKNFYASSWEWTYTYKKDAIGQAVELGIPVFSALTGPLSDRVDRESRHRGRMEDVNGLPVTAPWMPIDWGYWYGCSNNPAFNMVVMSTIKEALDSGATGFISDGVLPNEYMILHGGCFCNFCMDKFYPYLKANMSKVQQEQAGISSLESFDFKSYVKAHYGQMPEILRKHFADFQFESDKAHFEKIRTATDAYAGRHVLFGTNNGSWQTWERNQKLYDFGFAELSMETATPYHLYGTSLKSRAHGKFQIVNMPKFTPGTISDDTIVGIVKKVIGTGYACGVPVIIPWDVWLTGKIRYFGKAEDFAYMYKFVKDNARYFDNYEDAFAVGETIRDARYSGQEPVRIMDGSGQVYAFVRAVPKMADKAVVIHLVDWSSKPEDFTILLNRERFFKEGAVLVKLLAPGKDAVLLSEGGQKYVHVPRVAPWGMLVLEKSNATAIPEQPDISPFGGVFSGQMQVKISQGGGGEIRYTLDGSEPDVKSPKYNRIIVLKDSATVTAKVFDMTGGKSGSVRAKFTFARPKSSVSVSGVRPGLAFKVYKGMFKRFPDFDSLAAVKTGAVANVEINAAKMSESFAMKFEGFIRAPQKGLYRFFVRADDECKLKVDGEEVVFNSGRKFGVEEMKKLAESRGEHYEEAAAPEVWKTGITKQGYIALEEGMHGIEIEYTQMLAAKHLEIEWQGPSFERRRVPEDVLFCKE